MCSDPSLWAVEAHFGPRSQLRQALYPHRWYIDFQGTSKYAASHQMSALSHHEINSSYQDGV